MGNVCLTATPTTAAVDVAAEQSTEVEVEVEVEVEPNVGKHRKQRRTKRSTEYSRSVGWSGEEDEMLCKMVQERGDGTWALLARHLTAATGHERTNKQCRDRWHNHLRPDIDKSPFSAEEDLIVLQRYAETGSWAAMTQYLPGRSDNDIKNRWHSLKRRKANG